jgi:tetratricopeptide (TPR) repeat protein
MANPDHEAQLRSLLAPGPGARVRRAEALRRVHADPVRYVPIACALANHELPEVSEASSTLLGALLDGAQPLETSLLVLRFLPARCAALSTVAATVTEHVLRGLQAPGGFSDDTRAELLNNLSERLAELGDHARALECARETVGLFRRVAEGGPPHPLGLVTALNTLAKRLAASGYLPAACEAAMEAVEIATRLASGGGAREAVLLGRALTNLANRLSAMGRHGDALPLGLRAVEVFATLEGLEAGNAADLALARLASANSLIRLGRFRDASGHAKAAFDGFRPLAARNPGEFWECLLAAANGLSIALAQGGRAREACSVLGANLRGFDNLATKHPHTYGAEFVAYLVSYSASLGEIGERSRALAFGKEAVVRARRLRSVPNVDAAFWEGRALNNLFNRHYESCGYPEACKVASAAIRRLRQVKEASMESREDLTRALRNHAEGLRMTTETPAERRRAIRVARTATQSAMALPKPDDPGAHQLLAQCLSTLAQCQSEDGDPVGATRSESESLELRRRLFEAEPETYRRDLAYSLRRLAEHQLSIGDSRRSLRHVAESIRHYRLIARNSDEDLSDHEAEALRVRAGGLLACGSQVGALRSFRSALDLLLRGYPRNPDSFRIHIFRHLPEYIQLRTTLGLELESDLTDWVRGEQALQEARATADLGS